MSLSATDTLLAAIEANPTTIRDGADSLSLLFWWKREGGDGPGFGAALQALFQQRLIEIVPGPDMRLRLTAEGFDRLDHLLPIEAPEGPPAAATDPSENDDASWRGGAVAGVRDAPVEQVVQTLIGILATLSVPADRAISADTMAKIWAMEGKRGGDLRTAVDALAASGDLVIQRGARTVFTLTEAGAARVAAATAILPRPAL